MGGRMEEMSGWSGWIGTLVMYKRANAYAVGREKEGIVEGKRKGQTH